MSERESLNLPFDMHDIIISLASSLSLSAPLFLLFLSAPFSYIYFQDDLARVLLLRHFLPLSSTFLSSQFSSSPLALLPQQLLCDFIPRASSPPPKKKKMNRITTPPLPLGIDIAFFMVPHAYVADVASVACLCHPWRSNFTRRTRCIQCPRDS